MFLISSAVALQLFVYLFISNFFAASHRLKPGGSNNPTAIFPEIAWSCYFLLCEQGKISVHKSTQRVEVAIGKIRMPEQTLQPLFYCICLLCMCVCVPNPFGQTSLSGFHTNMEIWEL